MHTRVKSEDQIREDLRKFFIESFFVGDTTVELRDSDEFMETGTVSSTGILDVIMFLEQHFDFTIHDHEVVSENLGSIDRLIKFVNRKQCAP
jgi:acyl carrier protein